MSLRTIYDPESFICQNTKVGKVPAAPEIELHLADEAMALWQKTEDELDEIGLPPPFWAFAWAGGQALARYVLDHPELVAGKSVLDFAAGSGLVAIAAMKAGARAATAVDIDPFAVAAAQSNGHLNSVEIRGHLGDITNEPPLDTDIVFCGDIFYELPMSRRVLSWLDGMLDQKVPVLVGDPGRTYLPRERLDKLGSYSIEVIASLEDVSVKETGVYALKHGPWFFAKEND